MYPGMQVPSSYYPGNMQWPPNEDRSHSDKTSYKKKKKNKQSQVADHFEEDESTTSSEYTDESDSDADSKQKELFNGASAQKDAWKEILKESSYP
jgi:hypothetical protein